MRKTVTITASLGEKFAITGGLGHFEARVDQPRDAGGEDSAPTPLDYLLFSLAACQATLARIVAMQRRVDLRKFDVRVEADLETDALLGKSDSERSGFQSITVTVDMDADLDAEGRRAFIEEVDRRCPVSENLHHTTPLTIRLADGR